SPNNANWLFNITATSGVPSSEFIEQDSTATNASGYAEYNFNPGCSVGVGIQKWQFWTQLGDGDAYYANASDRGNITITGKLSPNVTTIGAETVNKGSKINISVNVQDACNNYITNANIDMRVYNDTENLEYTCNNIFNLNNGTYRCQLPTENKQIAKYDVDINASGVQYYANGSDIQTESIEIVAAFAEENIAATYYPSQVFHNQSFTVRATAETLLANADSVNASITVPEGWRVGDQLKELHTESAGSHTNVTWSLYPRVVVNRTYSLTINVSNENDTANTTINLTGFQLQDLGAPSTAVIG
ncbi:MAG: hypothetical protein SVU32_06690, partial [Candidatus Nanohaloarchaea archaeon]|nr:hypothetical protein [Candidatus Nanohaloarchaea archaeon]